MGKLSTLACAALATFLLAGTATAQPKKGFQLNQPVKRTATVQSQFAAVPLKTTPKKASSVAEDILIDEDFSAMTSGTVDAPDTTQFLAYAYGAPGTTIDPSLTKDGSWNGSKVYSAGGAIALKTYNPQSQAYINTPLGDYSGDLTITLRCKANTAVYNKTDGGYSYSRGSGLYIMICKGGYDNLSLANTDDESGYYNVRLYTNQGWTKVTYTVKNYSANKDGYITFYTEGSIVLDDIQITTKPTFLANPVVDGITDFQKDQFTFAWQPVRKAYNYYIDLYKKAYTSEEKGVWSQDFENFTADENWQTTGHTSAGEGCDESTALILNDGDSLTMPTNGADYENCHFYLKIIDPTVEEWYYTEGYIVLDVKTNEGWKNVGYYYAANFFNGDTVKLEEEYKNFYNGVQQVRIHPEGISEGAYLIVDNVDIVAGRPFEYELVEGENSVNYGDYSGGNYIYYDTQAATKPTQYTFTGLDPETEYYYGVRAHYVYTFSERILHHALGVAAPDVLPATDIDSRGSYTANWEKAPKATGYTVSCYGAYIAEADEQGHTVLEEDFDAIDGNVTSATSLGEATPLNNYDDISLNDYTQVPGWVGFYNALAQGMLCANGDGYYTGGTITTPMLDLSHGDECEVTLTAYGTAGDILIIRADGTNYQIQFPEGGVIDGTFVLPVTASREQLEFFSYYSVPVGIDFIRVAQDLKQGDVVLTWLDDATVDGDQTSYTFTDLYDYGFEYYAYDVTSHFVMGHEETSSLTPSEIMIVDLEGGVSYTGISEVAGSESVKEVARYSINGLQLQAPQKGINIVKMSDGTTRKVLVK